MSVNRITPSQLLNIGDQSRLRTLAITPFDSFEDRYVLLVTFDPITEAMIVKHHGRDDLLP